MKINVPSEVEPDLKNVHEMKEIWEVLDKKYGSVMELSKELVMGLQKFRFSPAAKTESAKFKEICREFTSSSWAMFCTAAWPDRTCCSCTLSEPR